MHLDKVLSDYILIKLKALLILGGAVVLVGCGSSGGASNKSGESKEGVMTESSTNLKIKMSENGRPSYIFEAPLVEGYGMASEPYRIFREGVKITTFSNDSLTNEVYESGNLVANYAIYYEEKQLWEAIGDVYATNIDGKVLTSQQLFWNSQTQRIFSNVDTRIEDRATGDIYDGEGFESDETMNDWRFRRLKGRMRVEPPAQNRASVVADVEVDSLMVDSLAVEAVEAVEESEPVELVESVETVDSLVVEAVETVEPQEEEEIE